MNENKFYIINLTNRDLKIQDLNYTLKAHASVNLLGLKGVSYTIQQLEASAANGSLFKKKDSVKITSSINTTKAKLKEAYGLPWPNRKRVGGQAVDPAEFEEIPLFDESPFISDEKFADEFSAEDTK